MFVVPPQPQCALSVRDKRYRLFPVNAIYGCTGNFPETGPFALHSRALTTLFQNPKKGVADLPWGARFEGCAAGVHLAAVIGRDGKAVSPDESLRCVWGWSVALSLESGALAREAGEGAGLNLPGSLIMTSILPVARALDPVNSDMWLYADNQRVLSENTSRMIRPIGELLSLVSRLWGLRSGDVILSGSPLTGVVVRKGIALEAGIGGIGSLRVRLS